MDFVQIYTLTICIINCIVLGISLGSGKDIYSIVIGQLLSIPVYGRIFGWW
jgi:hypothetical protein